MRTFDIICKTDSTQKEIVNIQGMGSVIYSEMFSDKVCLEAESLSFEASVELGKLNCSTKWTLHVLCSKAIMTVSVLRDTIRSTLCAFDIRHRLNIQ